MIDKTRDFLNQDINSLLKMIIDKEEDDNFEQKYVGKVLDNKDPEKLGRCKINVFGIYDEIKDPNDLPWAMPDFQFVGSQMGSFVVPPINAIVRVYFDHGDVYLPHYSTKVVEKSKLSNKRLENYPDTMIIFETDEGDYLTMNRKSKKFTFHHNSGNKIDINKNGDTNILINGNKDDLVKGDETHTVLGDHTIQNGNVASIKIESNGNITMTGGTITIDHTVSLNVKGKTVIPTGTGPLNAIPTCPLIGMLHSGNVCL